MQPEGRDAVVNRGTQLSQKPKSAAHEGQARPKTGGGKKA